ncbi:MAG: hypothetical protein J2P36_26625, partial [Ktedonobacteraceae bacterium]|nr:hypothetical protein [Ktedonobacteraceae bacterium]
SCGAQLAGTPAPAGYTQGQYPPNTQYSQPYPQQQPYQQSPYPQPYPNYQQPMVLRCPTCMAIAPLGTPVCAGCRTSLAGVAPVPQNMPVQGQQGGFFQGDGGKLAMGALGGAAAVIGGQMLLHNLEDSFDGDHHHHHGGGVLGDLGELADDVGLI